MIPYSIPSFYFRRRGPYTEAKAHDTADVVKRSHSYFYPPSHMFIWTCVVDLILVYRRRGYKTDWVGLKHYCICVLFIFGRCRRSITSGTCSVFISVSVDRLSCRETQREKLVVQTPSQPMQTSCRTACHCQPRVPFWSRNNTCRDLSVNPL